MKIDRIEMKCWVLVVVAGLLGFSGCGKEEPEEVEPVKGVQAAETDKVETAEKVPVKVEQPKAVVKRPMPVVKLQAILGSRIMCDGTWYEIGESVRGMKILEVGVDNATVEWDGEKAKIYLEESAGASGSNGSQSDDAVEETPDGGGSQEQPEQKGEEQAGEDPLAWLGFENLTPDQREKLEYFIKNAPSEMLEMMKAGMGNISDEMRQEMLKNLEGTSMAEIRQAVDEMNYRYQMMTDEDKERMREMMQQRRNR